MGYSTKLLQLHRFCSVQWEYFKLL